MSIIDQDKLVDRERIVELAKATLADYGQVEPMDDYDMARLSDLLALGSSALVVVDFVAQQINHERTIAEGYGMSVRWHALRKDLKESARVEAVKRVTDWHADEERVQQMKRNVPVDQWTTSVESINEVFDQLVTLGTQRFSVGWAEVTRPQIIMTWAEAEDRKDLSKHHDHIRHTLAQHGAPLVLLPEGVTRNEFHEALTNYALNKSEGLVATMAFE